MKYPVNISVLMNTWKIKIAKEVSATEYKLVDYTVADAVKIVGHRDAFNEYYTLLKNKAPTKDLIDQWRVCVLYVNEYNAKITSKVWLNRSAAKAAEYEQNSTKYVYTDADIMSYRQQLNDEYVQLIAQLDVLEVHDVMTASDDELDTRVRLAKDYGVEPVEFVKAAYAGETTRYYFSDITRGAKINCILKAMILAQYEDEFLTKVEVPSDEGSNRWISNRELRTSGKTISDLINVEYRDFTYDADDIINA